MPSYLPPTASLPKINLVLSKFNIPGWHVHPRIVEFNDKADKSKKMATYTNKMKAAGYDQQTIDMLVGESLEGDTISEGVKGMKQKGTVALLSGDWERSVGNPASPGEKKLHVQLLFLKERKVYIYDPDWEVSPPREITEDMKKKMEAEHRKTLDHRPRLTELGGGARIRLFVDGLRKNGFQINEYWTGGGGNDGFQCLAMCQQLLQQMERGGEEDLNLAWAEEELRL
ncbi:hypothetical protein V500_03132 [Pseudogymnoascus sp. VKM F-4518 (FW-2643)]|nr:hypothetical protein V500_03132 [Pseudogymnoascus sp. VKM F-4518 (FW-2643)]